MAVRRVSAGGLSGGGGVPNASIEDPTFLLTGDGAGAAPDSTGYTPVSALPPLAVESLSVAGDGDLLIESGKRIILSADGGVEVKPQMPRSIHDAASVGYLLRAAGVITLATEGSVTYPLQAAANGATEAFGTGFTLAWTDDLVCGDLGGFPGVFGIRFPAVPLPGAAYILSAFIRARLRKQNSPTFLMDVFARKVADASDNPSNSSLPGGWARTTAKTTINSALLPTSYTLMDIDVTHILKEILADTAFASGNGMAFPFVYQGSAPSGNARVDLGGGIDVAGTVLHVYYGLT